jgi:acyl-CoA synthetase (AMP-forming)/AMP-acid ligase II
VVNRLSDVVTPPARAAQLRADGLWTTETLSGRVAAMAVEPGASVAVVDRLGERSRTYAQLAADAAALAARLADHGVASGAVVAVQLPNWYETVVAAVAVNALGAVINPLLPNYRAREVAHVVTTARPAAILTPALYRGFDHRELVADVTAATGLRPYHLVVEETGIDGAGTDPVALRPVARASDVSELIFTSGTEATPKAIMHTEETANFGARSLFAALGLGADTAVWMPSPVGHSTGFNYGLRMALVHGAPLVLQDRWDPADAMALVSAYAGRYTLAATTFLEDLVGACERAGTRLPSLTHFGCGGAPVPAPLVARAEAVGIQVLRLYGSTEVLCATWNRPDSPAEKRGTTDGYALPHNEIQVRDDEGRVLAPPAVGELHVRGPNTSVGFFADPERTAATYLPDGFVRSGDLASLDADGYLAIVGRKKEIIIRGGVNIAPREIEDLIADFPEVRAVAVVPVPDERLGERGCACVVLQDGATLDFETTVGRLRATGLATYKLPERFVILDDLPRTASGKVQKHEILRRLETTGGTTGRGHDA